MDAQNVVRTLLPPALYGGSAAAIVGTLGYWLALSQSVSIYLTTLIYLFVGFTGLALLVGASSFNENSESPDSMADEGEILSAPTESGAPRRLLLICFSLGLVLAGVVGVALLG